MSTFVHSSALNVERQLHQPIQVRSPLPPTPGEHVPGTTGHLVPGVRLDERGYSRAMYWWSLDIFPFETWHIWAGARPTQRGCNGCTTYESVCFGKIRFPRAVSNEDGKQFVEGASRPPFRDPCPHNLYATTELEHRTPVRNSTRCSRVEMPYFFHAD